MNLKTPSARFAAEALAGRLTSLVTGVSRISHVVWSRVYGIQISYRKLSNNWQRFYNSRLSFELKKLLIRLGYELRVFF